MTEYLNIHAITITGLFGLWKQFCASSKQFSSFLLLETLHFDFLKFSTVQKQLKHVMSHIITLDDMLLRYHEHTHTRVYFDSIHRASSCCQKYSLKQQMWIISLIKIVPINALFPPSNSFLLPVKNLISPNLINVLFITNKCTIFSQ